MSRDPVVRDTDVGPSVFGAVVGMLGCDGDRRAARDFEEMIPQGLDRKPPDGRDALDPTLDANAEWPT